MTTYMYTLRLGDSEIIMLQSALKLMINHCEENLKDGPKAPYLADKQAALNVLDKLFEDTKQMSGNNFNSSQGNDTITN